MRGCNNVNELHPSSQQLTTMTTSSCICTEKKSPPSPESWDYPEWKDGADNINVFQRNGYFVVRGLISEEEIEDTKSAITGIVQKWFQELKSKDATEEKDWEEIANRLPTLQGTDAKEDDELTIRRLFRMALHDQFFAQFCRHSKILSVVRELLGNDVKLLQSMCLLKPPGSGQKKWHQDNAYFRLTPARVVGVWIALDPTDCTNGCMHVLPSSHGVGVYPHAAPAGNHIDYSLVTLPNAEDVVPVIMSPGDALVFHGETAHYTPPNISETRRRSVQLHYASSHCKPTKCPRKEGESHTDPTLPPHPEKPHYFDCDPQCNEPEYWYYRKAEVLVSGEDFGGDYI